MHRKSYLTFLLENSYVQKKGFWAYLKEGDEQAFQLQFFLKWAVNGKSKYA